MKTRLKKRRDGKVDIWFEKSKTAKANVGLTVKELLQLSININMYLGQHFLVQSKKE